MQVKLKRIAPLQAGKMLGVFYAAFSLLFVPFMIFFFAVGSMAAKAQGQAMPPGMGMLFGFGMIGLLFVPVIYGVLGFVFGALAALLYNLLARWIGGLDLTFETTEEPPKLAPGMSGQNP
ncbi:MAG TPA: hypothetical protein VIM71_11770 [Lacunisphaera sp.]